MEAIVVANADVNSDIKSKLHEKDHAAKNVSVYSDGSIQQGPKFQV